MMSLKKIFFPLILLFSLNSFGNSKAKKLIPSLLKKNNFAMIRHSIAPGMGDPDFFKLRDCKTQRNLSKEGREQSIKIGKLFKDHKVKKANVYSSQWCRCIETAEYMNLGKINVEPGLNSFFQEIVTKEKTLSILRERLNEIESNQQLVLMVTHQVTITAVTGITVSSGGVVAFSTKSGESREVKILY